jgi:DNA-binding beta-propeller fold protein YncE
MFRSPILWCISGLLLAGQAAFSQSSEKFLVTDFNTALTHVFDAASNKELSAIRVGASPGSIVVSPNGRLAFVADVNSNFISVIDLTTGAEIKRIRNVRVGALAMSADGSLLVGNDIDDDGLTVIDAVALTVSKTISINGKLGDDPTIPDNIPSAPVIVGNKVYLETLFDFGVVDLGTGSVTDLGSAPASIGALAFNAGFTAATADGKFVIISRSGGLVVIDTATASVVQTINANFVFTVGASRNATDPTRIFAYLLHTSTLGRSFAIMDLSSGSPTFGLIVGEVALPPSFQIDVLAHIASNSAGTRAFLSSENSPTNILEIDTSVPSAPVVLPGLSVGSLLRSITVAFTADAATATAPVVTGVNTPLVRNDTPAAVQISGSGFASDAQVKFGNLDPVPAQFISSSLLQVTPPLDAPAQGAAIIVTNPDQSQGVTGSDQSGILRNSFIIASAPTFQPANQVAISDFGDETLAILNVSTNTTLTPAILAPQRVGGVAISPDGLRAYVESFTTAGTAATVSVFNFATNSFEPSIILNGVPGGIPGQTKGIAIAPQFGSTHPAAYVASSKRVAPGADGFVLELYEIDIDPTSPTFKSVKTFATPAPHPGNTSGGLAVTPDGHFAFVFAFQLNVANVSLVADGNLIVVDLTTGATTMIPTSSLGVSFFQFAPEMTADGKFLLLTTDNGPVVVFDISSPTAPTLVATITGAPPAGFPFFFITPRVVGNKLYAFDQIQNIVGIFNFNPAANDFAQLATFVVPGTPTLFGTVHDVTPDGKLIYLPLREEDSIAVVDAAKVLANDPTALLTKIGTGIAPTLAVVRPGTPTPAGTNVPVQPVAPVSLLFSNVTTPGTTSVTTTNTNPDPLPAGFSLGTPPVYYEISTTAVFSGAIQVCITYNPAQFAPPESAIRLLHDENGVFIDRTTSQDLVNHIVCGNVTHFSAFTVGNASVSFLYDSLLREVRSGVSNSSTQKSLADKVQDSRKEFNEHENGEAIEELRDFQHKVQQAGSLITRDEASRLIALANAIITRSQAGQ